MCAFSQEHALLKQLFQQNWIDDCGKKGTNKNRNVHLKNKKNFPLQQGMLMRDFTCARKFAGSALGLSCLKRLSADNTSSRWLRTQMGAEKETEHFFLEQRRLIRVCTCRHSRENILSGVNCSQRLSAVDTCTFDCGHKLGVENRKI